MPDAAYPLTRVRPYDIQEIIEKWGAISLELVIINMREGLEYVCPKCSTEGDTSGTGRYEIEVVNPEDGTVTTYKVHCDVCDGVGKTAVEYEPITKITGYQPVPVPPPTPD
jgi:hypothetical protein